ncbi:MAG: ABC transporter substrate-binding protein [Hyphomicrobiales bacterium]|nr:ABC transporter substrate-binding protein [Hyphomicrobiales bacterium]
MNCKRTIESRILLFGFLLGLAASLFPQSAQALVVTDLAGREVTLEKPAQKILLGEGRFIQAIGILDQDDPTRRVVGMLDDFRRFDPAGYAQYQAAFPAIASIPSYGRTSRDTISIETLISLAPDVAIFGVTGHGPSANSKEIIEQIEAAGIPVVFIDFRLDPIANTPKSVEVLGKVLGKEQKAQEFTTLYRDELAKVSEPLRQAGFVKPSVFLEVHVGLRSECCFTMGNGMLSKLIEFAGGENMAKPLVPGVVGAVNLEYLIANPPDIYVGTAVGSASTWDRTPPRIALGADVSREVAKKSLAAALDRTGIRDLPAVKAGRAYGVWHHFYNSPLNVYAVQAMAKAFHPELFKDLEPETTLKTLYDRFQPIELNGTYWIKLDP